MKKLLICLLLFPFNIFALDLATNSKSAILIEESTKEVIYNKNENEKLAPASMTKIMSLILIMESIKNGQINMNEDVVISEHASSMGGSQMFLETNSKVKVKDLIKGIAIASGNDAVVALAEKIGGSEEEFVNLMNEKVKELKLENTHFVNPHGLDADNHYSSAYDMAMMGLELLKYPEILKYTSIYEEYFEKSDGTKIWMVNSNKLVRFYEGIDGLKTGYTDNAKYCITATGKKNNLRFISVVMGADSSENRSKDVVSMFNYGFSNYKIEKIIDKSEDLGNVKVINGTKKTLKIKLNNNIVELKKANEKKSKYKYIIKKKELKAPVKNNEVIAELTIIKDNKEYKTININSSEMINKNNFINTLLDSFKNLIAGKQ